MPRIPATLFSVLALAVITPAPGAAGDRLLREADLAHARLLSPLVRCLLPLHQPLGRPEPGEWLYAHRERGQTFWQYVDEARNLPTRRRDTIYVQPLGSFGTRQYRIIYDAAQFLCIYYNLKVRVQPKLPLAVIPPAKRRVIKASGVPQLDIDTVLGGILRRDFPLDAAARVALTSADLERPRGRNLTSVFGMAFLYHRTAVCSLYRVGGPGESRDDYRRCLRRTLKLLTHETGHALSMRHCTRMRCNMNGQNSLLEMDRKPLWLCPDCLAKVCWASRADPVRRFRRLRDFCAGHGLAKEASFYRRSARLAADRQKRRRYLARRKQSCAGAFPGEYRSRGSYRPAGRTDLAMSGGQR